MIVFSLSNTKGGCAKSVSTLNLASALSSQMGERNKRVLCIDLDPSNDLTSAVGLTANNLKATSYDVIIGKRHIGESIISNLDNFSFDILPASKDLSAANADFITIYQETSRQPEKFLAKQIDDIRDRYDFVLIDHNPSFNKILISGLLASDYILIPVQPGYFSLLALEQMMETINNIKDVFDKKNIDYRIFLSMFDNKRVLDRDTEKTISEQLPGKLLPTKIRNNVAIGEAVSNHLSIFDYQKNANGAEDYLSLANDIISLGEQK